jgi:hypothetical protein
MGRDVGVRLVGTEVRDADGPKVDGEMVATCIGAPVTAALGTPVVAHSGMGAALGSLEGKYSRLPRTSSEGAKVSAKLGVRGRVDPTS